MLEASNGFFADATFCARNKSTRTPQYGQVLVFCPSHVSIKPWHFVHFTMTAGFNSFLLPKGFSTQ